MHCPVCNAPETKVIDSRALPEGTAIRRRRKCESCHKRFTTYEKLELQQPAIFKNDGRRESYNRDKIFKGIKKACHKRPISIEKIDCVVESLEKYILENFDKEISTKEIGSVVMSHLIKIDPVAYVRFASFYWNYQDVQGFVKELQQNLDISNLSTNDSEEADDEQLQ